MYNQKLHHSLSSLFEVLCTLAKKHDNLLKFALWVNTLYVFLITYFYLAQYQFTVNIKIKHFLLNQIECPFNGRARYLVLPAIVSIKINIAALKNVAGFSSKCWSSILKAIAKSEYFLSVAAERQRSRHLNECPCYKSSVL